MSRASGDPPQSSRNNIPDLLRAISMKASVKDERSATKRRLERGWRDFAFFRKKAIYAGPKFSAIS